MITLTTLFTLLYGYSIYKIRKDSGSWKNFDLYSYGMISNPILFWVFMLGTAMLVVSILTFIICAVIFGIIP